MRKLLIAISMVLVLGGSSAFAGGSSRGPSFIGYTSGPISTTNQVVNTRGTVIYNITLNAYSALATLTLYDVSAGPITTEVPVYEVEVAVAGDSRTVDMNAAPLQTFQGLVASVTNGVAYLNVQK